MFVEHLCAGIDIVIVAVPFASWPPPSGSRLQAMPVGPYLYGKDLNEALMTMHKAKMYKQVRFADLV